MDRKEYMRKWRAANVDKVRAQRSRWNAANHDRVLDHKTNFRRRHPDRVKAWIQAWGSRKENENSLTNLQIFRRHFHQANRESLLDKRRAYFQTHKSEEVARSLAYYRKNRNRVLNYLRNWSRRTNGWILMLEKWERIQHLCYICGAVVALEDLTLDHVIPSSKGGSDTFENLMPVHRTCNCRKGNKLDYQIERFDLVEHSNEAVPVLTME